jgi:hypothetical protein
MLHKIKYDLCASSMIASQSEEKQMQGIAFRGQTSCSSGQVGRHFDQVRYSSGQVSRRFYHARCASSHANCCFDQEDIAHSHSQTI